MPKITEYQAPELGFRPSEHGIEATAGAARRLQGDYSEAATAQEATGRRFASAIEQAGDTAVKFIDHQQISHGAVALAGLIQQKTKEWDNASKASDPNDPTTAQRFLDQNLEPALQEFKKGFLTERGQQWAEQHIESFRSHMYNKTSADMATNAGIAAVNNHRQTVNGLAAAVYNDPSSLDFSLKTLEGSVGATIDSSPTLKGTAATKLKSDLLQKGKEDIVKSAVMGMIARDPNVDLSEIEKKYPGLITGPEMRQFQKAAQTQERANRLQQVTIERYERQQADLRVHAAMNKIMTDHTIVDPITGQVTIGPKFIPSVMDMVRQNADAPSAATTGKVWVDWAQVQLNKESAPRSNPNVRQNLIDRMNAPDRPTTEIEIRQAEVNHQLSRTDAQELLGLEKAHRERPEGESIRRRREEFFKGIQPMVYSKMDVDVEPSRLGVQRFYEMQMDARKKEEELRRAGKDPMSVYDPASPEYFGLPERVARYHVSMQEDAKYRREVETGKRPAGATPLATLPPPKFMPPPSWVYSPSSKIFKDPATNKKYDLNGKELK